MRCMRFLARSSRSLQRPGRPARSRSRDWRAARSAARKARAGSRVVASASTASSPLAFSPLASPGASTRSISPTTATQRVQGPGRPSSSRPSSNTSSTGGGRRGRRGAASRAGMPHGSSAGGAGASGVALSRQARWIHVRAFAASPSSKARRAASIHAGPGASYAPLGAAQRRLMRPGREREVQPLPAPEAALRSGFERRRDAAGVGAEPLRIREESPGLACGERRRESVVRRRHGVAVRRRGNRRDALEPGRVRSLLRAAPHARELRPRRVEISPRERLARRRAGQMVSFEEGELRHRGDSRSAVLDARCAGQHCLRCARSLSTGSIAAFLGVRGLHQRLARSRQGGRPGRAVRSRAFGRVRRRGSKIRQVEVPA